MCKNNSWDYRFLELCSPHQIRDGLISDSPAIDYYSYTNRSILLKNKIW